jgi:hypothetical protein
MFFHVCQIVLWQILLTILVSEGTSSRPLLHDIWQHLRVIYPYNVVWLFKNSLVDSYISNHNLFRKIMGGPDIGLSNCRIANMFIRKWGPALQLFWGNSLLKQLWNLAKVNKLSLTKIITSFTSFFEFFDWVC